MRTPAQPSTVVTPPRGRDDIDAGVTAVIGDLAHERLLADLAAWPGRADIVIREAAGARWLGPATVTLAAAGNVNARSALAVNPACPPDVLTRLARDRSRAVWTAAVANPSCPIEAVHCSGDYAALLRHRDCPLGVLEEAVAYPTRRADAITNPTLPWAAVEGVLPDLTWPELVQLLTRADLTHPDAAGIIERIYTVETSDSDALWQALATWARHPNADPQWLHIQTEIARGRRSGGPRPARFGTSGTHVLAAVAANPSAPAAIIATLTTFRSRTGLAALAHPNCPPSAMSVALRWSDSFAQEGPLKASYLRSIARVVAANPAVPRSVLSSLGSGDLGTRGALAFAYAHATTGPHAQAVVAMLPSWSQTLSDVLDAAADLLTGSPPASPT